MLMELLLHCTHCFKHVPNTLLGLIKVEVNKLFIPIAQLRGEKAPKWLGLDLNVGSP